MKKNRTFFSDITLHVFMISAFLINPLENINECRRVTADAGLNIRIFPDLNLKRSL